MSQTKAKRIISKIRHEVGRRRKFCNPDGPEGRLLKMRHAVTALIKHERIELSYPTADESRGYAEVLISEAIKYGEKHKKTMELASYWLLEHQLVHKLFKVLVPRYQDCKFSYTKMWKAPKAYPSAHPEKCVLELRGNIYPELVQNINSNHFLLHNLLLDEARKDYEREQQILESKMKKDKPQGMEFVDLEECDEIKEMAKLENWNFGADEKDDEERDLTNDKINSTSTNNISSDDNNINN